MFSRFCLRAAVMMAAFGYITSISASTKPAKEASLGQFAAEHSLISNSTNAPATTEPAPGQFAAEQMLLSTVSNTDKALPTAKSAKKAKEKKEPKKTKPPKTTPLGQFAAQQIRHIATHFPGRMAGSPTELLAADYLKQQFANMGYSSNTRSFNAQYLYSKNDTSEDWNKIIVTSVIAAKKGKQNKQIIIMAHFDTYTPHNDSEVGNNLGGSALQGVDDNASGVGVMLELAQQMKDIPTAYTLRFLATSGEELKSLGAKNYLRRMTQEERDDTLLVINLDNLITGDQLYFHSGRNTAPEVAKITRDRALEIAQLYDIPAAINPGSEKYPKGTGCCSDHTVFDEAKMPILAVEATNWSLGDKDGYQQTAVSPQFTQGVTWHRPQYDNLQYLESNLPGRIDQRSHDIVQILLPLIKELAQAQPVIEQEKGKKKK
ncbi:MULTISPECIES: aminopeptidase [unclassified Serratia (in: enterobacteria)]|uniref:aminopeptidase n=1 Tax=unclassified Serratia (in: enterobacteria) TaxID=2647522 RepID=UPI000AB42EA8|nr:MULTISPECIES: aminopeptidase [unclassified Serratia (in: enterobacteria)]